MCAEATPYTQSPISTSRISLHRVGTHHHNITYKKKTLMTHKAIIRLLASNAFLWWCYYCKYLAICCGERMDCTHQQRWKKYNHIMNDLYTEHVLFQYVFCGVSDVFRKSGPYRFFGSLSITGFYLLFKFGRKKVVFICKYLIFRFFPWNI